MVLDIIRITKSFHSAVGPILDYASEVWGYKNFTQMQFKTRHLKYFWGCINLYLLLPSTDIWVGLLVVLDVKQI